MSTVNKDKWVRKEGHKDTICPALHNGRLQGRVWGCVWGVPLNSHNLNYSALDCAIDFLLDRLTESRALGQ